MQFQFVSSIIVSNNAPLTPPIFCDDSILNRSEKSTRRGPTSSKSTNHAPREKKQPLSLIKKTLSSHGSTREQKGGSTKKDKMNSGYSNKENIHSTQATSSGDDQNCHTVQLNQPAADASSTQRLQKKRRPGKNGRGNKVAVTDEQPPNEAELPMERPNRVSVDPPGAVLGTMPWMPPNHEAYHNANMYHNGIGSFSSVASWPFQPMPNLGHVQIPFHVPPFLAPLVDSVRHPFANFVGHHNAPYFGQNLQRHPAESQHCQPMDAEDPEVYSADEAADADALRDDSDENMDESPSIELPSTFAPDYVVERIRSRRLIENLADAKTPSNKKPLKQSQNRVLTRSAAKALKKKSTKAAVAHQAASPVSSRLEPSPAIGVDSPEPQVMTILGKRVTMIDPVRKVFVIDLLSPDQCDHIRQMADDHTRHCHDSGSCSPVWREFFSVCIFSLVIDISHVVSMLSMLRHPLHLYKNGSPGV